MANYAFKPTDDLTVQELAEIFKVTTVALIEGITGKPQTGSDELDFEPVIYNKLPESLKRHFQEKL